MIWFTFKGEKEAPKKILIYRIVFQNHKLPAHAKEIGGKQIL